MGALLQNNYDIAINLGKLLHEHNGGDVIVMDMRPLDFWTDYFVIVTATSNTHMSGLERHIKEFVRSSDLEIYHRSSRLKSDIEVSSNRSDSTELGPNEWSLLDLGGIVIHLMTSKSRSFYELERLWSNAPLIFKGEAHSSKSS